MSCNKDLNLRLTTTSTYLHRVRRIKGATKLTAVTSSNLNRFSKFFYPSGKFPTKPMCYFPQHYKYVAALLWEFKSSNLL